MVNRIQAAKARKHFASIVERSSQGERIKVTRYGRTLAAMGGNTMLGLFSIDPEAGALRDARPDRRPRSGAEK